MTIGSKSLEPLAMRKFLISMGAIVFLFSASVVQAQIATSDTGLNATGDSVYGTSIGGMNIGTYIGTYVIQPILALSGIICLISLMYAGFLWMSAMGDPKQVTKAKDLMLNTLIGVIVTVAAYGITQFVFATFT